MFALLRRRNFALLWFGGLISLIMCGFIAGTPGPNRFGEGPMA